MMNNKAYDLVQRLLRNGMILLALSLFLGLIACSQSEVIPAKSSEAAPAAAVPVTAPTTVSAPVKTDAADLKLLNVEPVKGTVGSAFTVTGEGLPPNKEVEFLWATVNGSFLTNITTSNIEYYDKEYTDRRLSLGRATSDAQGRVTVTLKAPEDYGETHDLFAAIGGQDVARGGYRLMRNVTISPDKGPVGTPITIKVTGLGWKPFESTIAVRYDNNFTGIITAVTTRGTATVQIRAAGRAGLHVIDIEHGARSLPFLNNQQSGTAHIPDSRFQFTITGDGGAPPLTLDWPDQAAVVTTPLTRTTSSNTAMAPGFSATMEPTSGPILTRTTLRAKGLAPNAGVELFWMNAKGNRISPTGWSLYETSLQTATTSADGTLAAEIQIPDDLGGWHMVKLVQGSKVMGEVPFFVEHSIAEVTPKRVKMGETFTVHVKGIGWTELDNGVAVTYDNAYIGFACGFNSNGDVTIILVATGTPGTHLIDLYPMIYQGHGKPPSGYQVPLLSFKQDAPGLGLGYRLPTFRLAIEIVE
ncbi:MAG: hypothetical protein HY326_03100 [Chloroflexi bacterium]|nr:hypothetical protein [Chloroflexota bacterium]